MTLITTTTTAAPSVMSTQTILSVRSTLTGQSRTYSEISRNRNRIHHSLQLSQPVQVKRDKIRLLIFIIVVVDGDKSFDKFFSENQYIDNPFGKDFIKLEVDLDRFDTNKTSINITPL